MSDIDDFVVFDEASVLWYRYTAEDVLTGYDCTEEPDVVRRGPTLHGASRGGARRGGALSRVPGPHPLSAALGKGTTRQRRLGGLLRRLRKAAGLSGPALAGRLGVSQSHLSRVELAEAVATAELVDT